MYAWIFNSYINTLTWVKNSRGRHQVGVSAVTTWRGTHSPQNNEAVNCGKVSDSLVNCSAEVEEIVCIDPGLIGLWQTK